MHNGELLTASQIADRTGLAVKTIQHRARAGERFDPRPRGGARGSRGKPARYEHNGESRTAHEWARLFGVTPQAIRARAARGAPLDGFVEGADLDVSAVGVFDDELRYEDDRAVRCVEAYMTCGELLMSDEEIRAQFADLGRLSDAGVEWAREQAKRDLFVNFRPNTDASLEAVGDFLGLCRERVRQVEQEAMRKMRAVLHDTGQEDGLRAELRDRDTLRQATWAERNDQEAPGDLGLSAWADRHSMTSLAKRCGRGADVSAALVASAQRGNAAAQRTRRARSA